MPEMKTWEMILNPLGIILTVYAFWMLREVLKARNRLRHGIAETGESPASFWGNVSSRTPVWFRLIVLVWMLAGVAVLAFEESLF